MSLSTATPDWPPLHCFIFLLFSKQHLVSFLTDHACDKSQHKTALREQSGLVPLKPERSFIPFSFCCYLIVFKEYDWRTCQVLRWGCFCRAPCWWRSLDRQPLLQPGKEKLSISKEQKKNTKNKNKKTTKSSSNNNKTRTKPQQNNNNNNNDNNHKETKLTSPERKTDPKVSNIEPRKNALVIVIVPAPTWTEFYQEVNL